MRDIEPQTLKFLSKTRGIEPIVILGIQWVKDGPEILYSDQKIDGQKYPYPYPSIVTISSLDTIQTVTSITETQSISISLDDTDGSIKNIIENNNICKQPVSVYFLFKGLPLENKTLFFTGFISSPIELSEGERLISFDAISGGQSIDVGFAMEEGDFPGIPEEALGKAWPIVFGKVCNMPATRVRSPRKGFLMRGEGIRDFTLEPRLCQARRIQCPAEAKGENVTKTGDSPAMILELRKPSMISGGAYAFIDARPSRSETEVIYGPESNCIAQRFIAICNILTNINNQASYEHDTITIEGGERFPQSTQITLNIGGAKFRGSFSGNTFTITDREHPKYAEWDHIPCHPIADRSYSLKVIKGDTRNWTKIYPGTAYKYTGPATTLTDCETQKTVSQESIGGPAASWEAFNEMESAGFHWCPAGSEVVLEDEREILNIVSLLPGTVDMVAAYYKMPSGKNILMEVPTDYYTIYNTNYGGYEVVEIGLEKDLSQYDENWDNQLYVSFTSTVGPNPVDIISWIIGKYTTYTVDLDSFAEVSAYLNNYPTNFWLQERKDALELIHDIAYQSRCGVYIRNNTIYLKYLSVEPSIDKTITEDNILANSLKIKFTETEDIKTKHIISWSKTGANIIQTDPTNLKLVLKHNIERYGNKEVSYSYYTQNTYSTILKSATFWLIRDSNIWKTVSFDTPLTNLELDIWDCVEIDTDYFSSKCILTQIQYDWERNTIHFEGWTPIKSGESSAYMWAWPALQEPLLTFPLPTDESQGAGYVFNVSPPIGHILLGGQSTSDYVLVTGDRHPSDLGDTYPSIFCEVSDTVEIEDIYEEVNFEAQIAESEARQGMRDNAESDGGMSYQLKSDKDDIPEKDRKYCTYEVKIGMIIPDLVSAKNPCSGPCQRGTGPHPCTASSTFDVIHSFGARYAAEQFRMEKRKYCGKYCPNMGSYTTGVPTQYTHCVSPVAVNCPPGAVEPPEEAPGDPEAPNQGLAYNPEVSNVTGDL
jgi:hypothetical protein